MTDLSRATFPVELRVPDVAERIVEGIVVPWDETSYLTPDPGGERFKRGSLTRTVRDRGNRIKLFRGHDHSRAYGLAVRWDPTHASGLFGQFRIGRGDAGDQLIEEVADGLLDSFSIGFRSIRESRAADGAREVLEASLHETSLAPIGAYDGARVLAVRTPGALDLDVPEAPTVNLDPLPALPDRFDA